MPTFAYQAKQGPTNIVRGTIEAPSQDEVVARLLREGLVPVSILITAESLGAGVSRRIRVRGKDARLFTRQLTSLLRARMELVPAVTVLKEQGASRAMRTLLGDLERHMRDGHPFSEALARHPGIFDTFFLSAIRAGEASGKLDDILLKLVEFGEQQEMLESRLRGALAYPVLLFGLGLASVGFFLWVVVPRMSSLFTQLGGALPGPTRFLINLSAFLTHHGLAVLVAAVILGALGRRLSRLPAAAVAWEAVVMRLPVFADARSARQIGRFTRTMQLLLDSGLPVFQALEIARPTLGSRILERRMAQAEASVKQGESIAASLKAARCFPPMVTQMIAVGESSGTLTHALAELAAYYERALDELLRILTSLLEPMMILVVGALVGFCVLAMVLPIFQMTSLVH